MNKALITGITGQDGSYLAELLLEKGYEVHGIVRRASTFNRQRISHLYQAPHEFSNNLYLHYGDMSDGTGLATLVKQIGPDEVYNLAGQSHVKVSFEVSEYTADVVALGTLRLLEILREHIQSAGHAVRFYQAGSSEMFGGTAPPQNEKSPFYPRSPYAVSKTAAHWFGVNFREAYGMFVCNGILFNHESPRRGEAFVTRKITRATARIKLGLEKKLFLGNLNAKRDWGYARDYVEAMWLMLQQETADDYVIATGESHSVREFVDEAFGYLNLDPRDFVETDPRYIRPTEVNSLLGDASKAKNILKWQPKVTFKELVRLMVDADLELARQECPLKESGRESVLENRLDEWK